MGPWNASRFADGSRASSLEEGARRVEDVLAAEEPLEIRVGGRPLAVTMRTPGPRRRPGRRVPGLRGRRSRRRDDFAAARYCAGRDDDGRNTYNVLDVTLARGVPAPDPSLERAFSRRQLVRAVRQGEHRRRAHPLALDRSATTTCASRPSCWPRSPTGCASGQEVFDKTGGLHAAGALRRRHRRAARAARGRRAAQRRRQGGRLGAHGGPAAAARDRADGLGARVVRAGAEGARWRASRCSPRSRRRRRWRSTWRASRDHAGRVPAGPSMVVYSRPERVLRQPASRRRSDDAQAAVDGPDVPGSHLARGVGGRAARPSSTRWSPRSRSWGRAARSSC